ncbi:MAG: phosphatase PAP2 family protein [Bacteroidota bacterium]
MIEKILNYDIEFFLYLNNLGTTKYDKFWFLLSEIEANIFFYLLALGIFIFYSKTKLNSKLIFLLTFIIILILIADQTSNLSKDFFERLRPCYNESIKSTVRLVKESCGGRFGFFSAHASNSFSLAIFFGLLLKKHSSIFIYISLVFASFISYSRIYLGVHFPLDIIFGGIFGILNGFIIFRLYQLFIKSFYKS